MIAAIVQTITDSLEQAKATIVDLVGVGIGTPGDVDAEAGAVASGGERPGVLRPCRARPARVQGARRSEDDLGNDVSVGVLGEYTRGAARPFTNVLGAWVGTGVGGGLILDGRAP